MEDLVVKQLRPTTNRDHLEHPKQVVLEAFQMPLQAQALTMAGFLQQLVGLVLALRPSNSSVASSALGLLLLRGNNFNNSERQAEEAEADSLWELAVLGPVRILQERNSLIAL
jgi:hypothetical protein